MKKTVIIVATAVVAVLAVIFFIISNNKINTYKEITYNELVELVDSGDKFILFIGSDSCSHCTMYKENLNIVIPKTHVLVNYIDITKISNEELAYINARFAFTATPTTVFIKAGKEDVAERVEKKYVGSLETKKIKELFIKYGYIEE